MTPTKFVGVRFGFKFYSINNRKISPKVKRYDTPDCGGLETK